MSDFKYQLFQMSTGMSMIPSLDEGSQLRVLIKIHRIPSESYQFSETMEKFISYLQQPKEKALHQFNIGKTNFTYIESKGQKVALLTRNS